MPGGGEGDQVRTSGPLKLDEEALPVGVVDVDHGGARRESRPGPRRDEQTPLGLEVVLHTAVEVEVVLGQVGERRDVEVDPRRAAEGQRMRGDLHHACPITRVEHPPERPLQVDRLRRRPLDLLGPSSDDLLDRPEQSTAEPRRFEDRADEEGGGGLAVGTGDPDHAELGARIAEPAGRNRRHRPPRVGDDQLRYVEIELPLGDQRGGPRRDHVGSEVVAVGGVPDDAEEEGPGADLPAVEGDVADLGRSVPTGDPGGNVARERPGKEFGAELVEPHQQRF